MEVPGRELRENRKLEFHASSFVKLPSVQAELNKVEVGAAKQISGCLRSPTTGFISPSEISDVLKLAGDSKDSGRRGSEARFCAISLEGMTCYLKWACPACPFLFWRERMNELSADRHSAKYQRIPKRIPALPH